MNLGHKTFYHSWMSRIALDSFLMLWREKNEWNFSVKQVEHFSIELQRQMKKRHKESSRVLSSLHYTFSLLVFFSLLFFFFCQLCYCCSFSFFPGFSTSVFRSQNTHNNNNNNTLLNCQQFKLGRRRGKKNFVSLIWILSLIIVIA